MAEQAAPQHSHAAANGPVGYQRRQPETTLLYQTVKAHGLLFLADLEAEGAELLAFVREEFEAYLRCGIMAHGLVHVRCRDCGHGRVAKLSCKRRGFRPSCLGRRMADAAAFCTENLFPKVTVRQFVLTVPIQMANSPALTGAVRRCFIAVVSRSWIPDGSGACYQGTCQGLVCVPNSRFCEGGNARTCTSNGQSSSLTATCQASQFCEAATGTCKTRVCEPGQPLCNGTTATVCNADGSGYAPGGTGCSLASEKCERGACKGHACLVGARFCERGHVAECNSDGVSWTMDQTCAEKQTCDPTTLTCVASVCTATQVTCNGNVATTCNADGSANDWDIGTYHSSGPISVPLRAGDFYAIGIFGQTKLTAYWSNQSATLPKAMSLGSLDSSKEDVSSGSTKPSTSTSWQVPGHIVYAQRLTTTP